MGCNHSKTDPIQQHYENKCWENILAIVNEYHTNKKLAPDWSVTSVDALLSKWVDIPRNVDELNRVSIWTRKILDSKSYTDPQIFRTQREQLAKTCLTDFKRIIV